VTHDAQDGAADGWRIGVDVGGTFTDLVLADTKGDVRVFKVPSVPTDPGQGVLNALEHAAERVGLPVRDLLGRCRIFVHGSTVATNTVLEGKGAKVGLLATEGFRDALEIRRGIRENPWMHRVPYPPVLVPRHLRVGVPGRIDRFGTEKKAIDEKAVRKAADVFAKAGVESIAICLFNSFLNPVHEQQVLSTLKAHWEGTWISVSSTISPVMGEYERTSTAVMNAYVAPRTVAYLQKLNTELQARGLRMPMLLIQNNGGAVSVDQVSDRPATLLLSGPAAGVGTLLHYAASTGTDNLISMEIGGTSCDVILISQGKVALTDSLEIGGYHLALPSVDVHTIGAGGGTIAGVDAGGLLFVGPEGAGARPGPACYGFGGENPTVTDAQVVLGRLRAGTYAGGTLTIDDRLAREAIERKIARRLGVSIETAAIGIIRLMEQKLLHAVQRLSIERGHDPRLFTLVAAGGAGPLHGPMIARALGCRRAYLPRLAGAFCALGMLHSDVRHDYVRVHLSPLEGADVDAIEQGYRALEGQALTMLTSEGFTRDRIELHRGADLRYLGQQWDIQVMSPGVAFDAQGLRRTFEQEHQRQFGHIQPDGIVEITKLRAVGIGKIEPLKVARQEEVHATPEPIETRRVWIDESSGWMDVRIYDGAGLRHGQTIDGPAIINEQTSTIMIGAKDRLRVDAIGNYVVELE
jgi:N-methylhydantoinase A